MRNMESFKWYRCVVCGWEETGVPNTLIEGCPKCHSPKVVMQYDSKIVPLMEIVCTRDPKISCINCNVGQEENCYKIIDQILDYSSKDTKDNFICFLCQYRSAILELKETIKNYEETNGCIL